ncbi:sensor histidine kinase [Halalkalibacter sp. APA_J-10(15)]|uniref:sensor histidine kinase n=1 Tax=Halalkalibacter sp. APA_J-10(15) TaxID=2933805 RepID=UPI001FF4646D|nr:sensor histidine kinase [Halalkalibacter sp. APA_J-10(15)]MCK0470150.1 sensor histidine kinase [Halalkalibacter sp. APA_J-10(15)]
MMQNKNSHLFSRLQRLGSQVFSRILIIYSVIIVFVIILLLLFIGRFLISEYIHQALEANEQTLDQIEAYFESRDQMLTSNLLRLYYNNELVESIAFALQNDLEEYWDYRLNQYYNSSSFVPSSIDSFVNTIYFSDMEIDAISLTSLETDHSFMYVFNHYNWNQMNMVDEMVTIPKVENGVTISKPIHEGVASKSIGMITAYYSLERLYNSIGFMDERQIGGVQVYSLENELLFNSIDELHGVTLPTGLSNNEQQTWSYNGETYYLNHRADPNIGVIYVGIIPETEIEGISSTYWIIAMMTILVSITVVLAGYFVLRKYARRMREIERSMLLVQDGDFNIRIDVSDGDKDELATISNSFNQMVEALRMYIQRSYVLDIKKQQAEMRALQSQINPHFLYNTLEAIRMKAVIEKSKTTANMIYHLANTLRYSLSEKQEVQLREELEHLRQYLKIMSYRFPKRLMIDYDVDESLLSIYVLRFILQPIAENYMIHGLRTDSDDNHFWIRIQRKSDFIMITLKDNGKGIETGRLSEINRMLELDHGEDLSTGSIGLLNIHQRIQLQYGSHYGMRIKSVEDIGTIVKLKIPIEKMK